MTHVFDFCKAYQVYQAIYQGRLLVMHTCIVVTEIVY